MICHHLGVAAGGWQVGVRAVEWSSVVRVAPSPPVVNLRHQTFNVKFRKYYLLSLILTCLTVPPWSCTPEQINIHSLLM